MIDEKNKTKEQLLNENEKLKQKLAETENAIIDLKQDVTNRKQAEETLRKNETKSQSWLEKSPVCTKIVDLDFNLQYMSSAGIKALKIDDVTKFYGKPYPMDFFPDSFKIPMIKDLKKVKETGKIISQESSLFDTDGNKLWFRATIIPVDDEKGQIDYFLVISLDISERKLVEQNLKAALEKAQESERLKSAFLANMSHEIRTPMNGILGFIDMLSTPGLSESKKQEFTNIISQSSNRLLNTINDLIDISKIEADQVKISKSDICVNKLLDELYVFFEPETKTKELSLISLPLSEDKTTILGDNDKLYGILRNLIKNAIKYTDKGSITYGCTLKNNYIEFFVEDTGIGVPEDQQETIFDRFIQADISNTRAFEGSGLGLSIAKAYVEMMGGKISLLSKEGKGSKFIFSIPT
jgi:PAS domain S-box-containing protein